MDILDIIPWNQRFDARRWKMTYSDGTVRKSQYRHDLIRKEEQTALTKEAKEEWPEWKGRVFD